MASTLLHELDWPHAAIELQLDHVHGDKVSAAYNHAEHLDVRTKMMQAWADYLDELKTKITPSCKAMIGQNMMIDNSIVLYALFEK